jgi:hypothetical protein
MEKMSKRAAFLTYVVNELHEVKCHICNERYFEGGVGLGGVMNFISYELGESLKEIEDEEVQEEEFDEECEEGSEEEEEDECLDPALEIAFEEKCEENRKLKSELLLLSENIIKIKEIIKDLIKNDHIFPGKVDFVIRSLADTCKEESVEKLYSIQAGRTIRMKE